MRLESSVPFTPLEVPKKEQENNERVNEADPTPFPRRRHDWRKGVPALNLEDSGSNPGRQFESSWIRTHDKKIPNAGKKYVYEYISQEA